MIDKIASSIAEALAGTPDRATALLGGFVCSVPRQADSYVFEVGYRSASHVAGNFASGS